MEIFYYCTTIFYEKDLKPSMVNDDSGRFKTQRCVIFSNAVKFFDNCG